MQYELRPKFHAMRVIRAMTSCGVSAAMGYDAFCLVTLIASTEDSFGYRKAVGFWNEQLTERLGCSLRQLIAARDRAIEAGFLEYEPGRKGVVGLYRTLLPEGFDYACTVEFDRESATTSAGKVPPQAYNILPVSLTLNPIPSPLTPNEKETLGDNELDKSSESEIDPAQRWNYERREPWAKRLSGVCQIGPNTWQRYKAIVDKFGLDRVEKIARNTVGQWKWPEDLARIIFEIDQTEPESEPTPPPSAVCLQAIDLWKRVGDAEVLRVMEWSADKAQRIEWALGFDSNAEYLLAHLPAVGVYPRDLNEDFSDPYQITNPTK